MAKTKVILPRTNPEVNATKLKYMAVSEMPVAALMVARRALIPTLILVTGWSSPMASGWSDACIREDARNRCDEDALGGRMWVAPQPLMERCPTATGENASAETRDVVIIPIRRTLPILTTFDFMIGIMSLFISVSQRRYSESFLNSTQLENLHSRELGLSTKT